MHPHGSLLRFWGHQVLKDTNELVYCVAITSFKPGTALIKKAGITRCSVRYHRCCRRDCLTTRTTVASISWYVLICSHTRSPIMVPQQPNLGWRNPGPILMVIYFGKHVWCEKTWGCYIAQQHNKFHDIQAGAKKSGMVLCTKSLIKSLRRITCPHRLSVHCSLLPSLPKWSSGRCCRKQLCTSNECSCYQKGMRARNFLPISV